MKTTRVLILSLVLLLSLGLAACAEETVSYDVIYRYDLAREALPPTNSLRTGGDAWYWNSDNTTKTDLTGTLSPLAYDYGLEQAAMERAAELVGRYSHTRPDGTPWHTVRDGMNGENIALGFPGAAETVSAWREDNEDYAGQGHRRNMLGKDFTVIGIGCVEFGGTLYWAQEFGTQATGEPESRLPDGRISKKMTVLGEDTSLAVAPDRIPLDIGGEAPLPDVTLQYSGKGYAPITVENVPWRSEDPSGVKIENGIIRALSAGTVGLTADLFGQTVKASVIAAANAEGTPEPRPAQEPEKPAADSDAKHDSYTLTIGALRREGFGINFTCTQYKTDASGKTVSSKELTTRQELEDNKITVETDLPYDESVLYGDDGHLYFQVDPSGSVGVGAYKLSVLWNGKVRNVLDIVITPSVYTLSVTPPSLSMTRSEFRNSPPRYVFSLVEDGSWPVSCEELGLTITCDLPGGSLTFDSQGNGLYTFSGTADVGTYTLSAKADVPLEGGTQAALEITRSDAVLTFDENEITRARGSLDGSGIAFIASMTADGYDLPFEDGHYTLSAPSLPGNPKAEVLPDGRLKISLTPGLETLPGEYALSLSAEGASAEAKLTVTPSVFTVTAEPPEISLITDYLDKNTQSLRFTVTADGHPLTGEAMTLLKAAVGAGSLKTDNSFAGDSVTVTPTLEKGSPLPDDGRYPVTVTLSSGESATAYVNLTMRSFTVVPEGNGYSLHREGLVKNTRPLTFRILENGRAMTKEEIEELYLTVSVDDRYAKAVKTAYEIRPDGSVDVTVFREKKWPFFSMFRASWIPRGTLAVTLKANSSGGSDNILLHWGDFHQEWLPYRIMPLLFLIWLAGMIFKKRFPIRARLYFCAAQKDSANQLPIAGNAWFAGPRLINLWCLVPYAADRRSIKGTGIRLRAAGGGVEYLCPPPSPNMVCYQFRRSKSIRPYEKGVLSVSGLRVTDLSRPNGKSNPRWHSFGAGIGLVYFDGSQYNIIIKQN